MRFTIGLLNFVKFHKTLMTILRN